MELINPKDINPVLVNVRKTRHHMFNHHRNAYTKGGMKKGVKSNITISEKAKPSQSRGSRFP